MGRECTDGTEMRTVEEECIDGSHFPTSVSVRNVDEMCSASMREDSSEREDISDENYECEDGIEGGVTPERTYPTRRARPTYGYRTRWRSLRTTASDEVSEHSEHKIVAHTYFLRAYGPSQ